jgi:taurine dioxygenase
MLKDRLSVRKAEGCGAFVDDLDLAELDAEGAAAVKTALFEHGVLFFENQSLTPEQHIAFAEQMSAIEINRFFTPIDGYPQIANVEKTPEQKTNVGGGWHTDHSYDAAPAMGSILVARALPPEGGDTLFADMYAAYATLDEATKAEIADLRAVHGSAHVFAPGAAASKGDQHGIGAKEGVETPESVHPVVIRHPGSGKPALYVNPGFTLRFEGMSRKQSQPLLQRLFAHAVQRERTHRFVWNPGSVAFWDNRATWHFARNDYHGHHRLMHRITLAGEALEAA